MDIPFYTGDIPHLTAGQMIEVDRAMIEDYRIDLIQMMENAGRSLAHLARARFLGGDPREQPVVVLAGTGSNGGGALVCARWLHNYGAQVRVFIARPDDDFKAAAAHQLEILRRMELPIALADDLPDPGTPALVIDGVIGYSLKGAPRDGAAGLIHWANAQACPLLALDTPSGVDATTGRVFNPAIRAAATLTLALPKEGLRAPGVEQQVGELYLADIGVPPTLYAGLGLVVPTIFAESDIVRLR